LPATSINNFVTKGQEELISIDIIIVNYNSSDYLIECLKTVFDSTEDILFNVFVQDNNSYDDVGRVCTNFPTVQLTRNTYNIGFSAAINKALKQSCSPFIVILNPDTLVSHGFFKSILQYMNEHPDIGILGPKILNTDRSVQGSARAFPTTITGFFGRSSPISRWFPNNILTRKNILTKKNGGVSPVEVDWVSGACMVVRRESVEDVGLMDERFFMYWEDVDWCRRMWQKGWKVVYYPASSIIHHVGGSSNKSLIRSRLYFHKSCYEYFVKYPLWPTNVTKAVFSVGLSIRFIILLLFDLRFSSSKTPIRKKPHILFFISEDWFFVSHFLSRATAALKNGYDVTVVTHVNKHKEIIEQRGIRVIPIKLERKSKNLLHELQHIINLCKIFKNEQPDIVHNIAIKPIIYGSMAALFARIPFVINAIVGLGAIFIKKGRKASIIQVVFLYVYKVLFYITKSKVIFENEDDIAMFLHDNIIRKDQVVLIKGAGVDVDRYKYFPEPNGIPVVVLLSRMLWDKGVGEFVNSAKLLSDQGQKCRFVLVGRPDPDNPESIPEKILNKWHSGNIIEWWGHRDDIPEILAESNIVVLPSYREGLPKVLLEAASCGRAIVSTDVPGCREIVRNNENGILVPPYDVKSLANAIKVLIKDTEVRQNMGLRGREIVENEFAEEIVVKQTIKLYEELLDNKNMGLGNCHTPLI
jgi:GT2 family glycosyltransferase